MKKKITLAASFAAATWLVAGQFTFADQTESSMNGMMNMMEAMNTPEGQKMMESCSEFMDSSNEK